MEKYSDAYLGHLSRSELLCEALRMRHALRLARRCIKEYREERDGLMPTPCPSAPPEPESSADRMNREFALAALPSRPSQRPRAAGESP